MRPEEQRTSDEWNDIRNKVINRMKIFCRKTDGSVETMVELMKATIEKGVMHSAMAPVEKGLVNEEARGNVRDDLEQ